MLSLTPAEPICQLLCIFLCGTVEHSCGIGTGTQQCLKKLLRSALCFTTAAIGGRFMWSILSALDVDYALSTRVLPENMSYSHCLVLARQSEEDVSESKAST